MPHEYTPLVTAHDTITLLDDGDDASAEAFNLPHRQHADRLAHASRLSQIRAEATALMNRIPATHGSTMSTVCGNAFRLVTAGGAGAIYSSADFGRTWDLQAPGGGFSGTFWASTVDANGMFILGALNGGLQTSPNGDAPWTARTSGFGASSIYAMTSRGSTSVAAGADGKTSVSSDGTTWSANTALIGVDFNIFDITTDIFATNTFVLCGWGGASTRANYIWRSGDGVTWTAVDLTSVLGADEVPEAIEWHGVLGFICLVRDTVTDARAIIRSTDGGVTWTKTTHALLTAMAVYFVHLVTTQAGIFVIHGSGMAYSIDGVTWAEFPALEADFNGTTSCIRIVSIGNARIWVGGNGYQFGGAFSSPLVLAA